MPPDPKFPIRCAYYPHVRVHPDPGGPSMTKQSFQDECDINVIMKKYEKTGLLDHVNKFGGYYGDLPQDVDYQTALNSVHMAEAAFGSLTADLRAKFHNNPAEFLAFVSDDANIEELNSLGLGPEPSPEPDPAATQSAAAPVAGETEPAPVAPPAAAPAPPVQLPS